MTQKEAEYVSLSRDTTESDLKQRREITSGTAVHIDQVSHRDMCQLRVLCTYSQLRQEVNHFSGS